jgi:hypothetical protein
MKMVNSGYYWNTRSEASTKNAEGDQRLGVREADEVSLVGAGIL